VSTVLAVWSQGRCLGEIGIQQGRWRFMYDAAWIDWPDAFPLSPHFPFVKEPFIDTADDKRVEWFFENLLPEGGLREALARCAGVSSQDTLALLRRYGEESAGALMILPAGTTCPTDNRYVPLAVGELRKRLTTTAGTPLLASSENLHMSLAGVQNKLGVRVKDDDLFLPQGAAASTHILKPENQHSDFPFCPANEFFCMQLAAQLNLPVPDISLRHLPEAVYLVRRFDRVVSGQAVQRKHQIDLCQLLNKWVGYKYESHGGVTSRDLFNSLDQLVQSAVARDRVLRWMVFNYLIGNTDAHGKNLAFMVGRAGIELAPFYDLLCVQAWLPDSAMAMSIQGENRPGWIGLAHWNALAAEAGVPESLVYAYLRRLAERIEAAADPLIGDGSFIEDERDFLAQKVIPVIRERVGYVREALMSEHSA